MTGRCPSLAARVPEAAAHGADQPAVPADHAGRSSSPPGAHVVEDSCRAGMSTRPSLASASCTQQARCRVSSSPASAGLRGHDLPLGGRDGSGAAGPGGARRCGARACSCRQAAIAPWSPDSSTGGHVEAAPRGRLGVDGVLQQAVLVRLLGQRLGVAHEAGQQPDHGLGDGQRGDLAAVEDVVAEGDLDAPRARSAAWSTTRWSMPS